MRVVELSVRSRTEGPWGVLAVVGEVDLYTAPKLREGVMGLVKEGVRQIVVDLTGVTLIDSTGLGVLVGALKRVKEQQGILALAAPTRPVRRVLSITGLDKVFPIFETAAEVAGSGRPAGG